MKADFFKEESFDHLCIKVTKEITPIALHRVCAFSIIHILDNIDVNVLVSQQQHSAPAKTWTPLSASINADSLPIPEAASDMKIQMPLFRG